MKFLVILSACVAISTGESQFRPFGPLGGFPLNVGTLGGFPGPLADVVPASTVVLVAHPNGAVTPAETPSVAAARRDHLLAKGAAFAAAGPFRAAPHALLAGPVAAPFPALAPALGIVPFPGPFADTIPASVNGLIAHPNGAVTPVETPSVAAARRDHFLASGAALAAAGPFLAAPHAFPVGPAGPFVRPAPALPASLGLGPFSAVPGLGGFLPGPGPTGALVAHPNGAVVPADEPAVVAARRAHLANFV